MKPNFALTFSSEGLRLLQRAPSGWLLVGDVAFESETLAKEAAELVAAAGRIDPAPLRTKLVIPNDQIKFMTANSLAKTEAEAEDDAAYTLRGATPYDLSDLRFDWAMDDGQLFIAAVARETLREAENFAVEHGFNPVSFVALPEQATFAGEPFFGVTKAAKSLLEPTETVMRDLQPIHVIGHADIPEPEPEPEPEAEPDAPDDQENESLLKEIEEASEPAPVSFASVRNQPQGEKAKPALDTVTAPAVQVEPPKRKGKLTLLPPEPAAPAAPPSPPATELKSAPAAPRKAAEKPATTKSEPAKPEPAKAKTTPSLAMFGLNKVAKSPLKIGGKPKHLGLILTAILLVFLAIMAAMASFFSPDGLAGLFRDPEPIQIAIAPPSGTATEEELAEAQDVEPAGDVMQGEAALPETDPVLLPDTPQVLTPEEALAKYIATGIWQIAPEQPHMPDTQGQAEAYLASIDPTVRTVDAIALPDIATQFDHAPPQRLNPAAAGTAYDLDLRGLVKATPEGALTPDGIKVFSGKPPLAPPQTPTRFAQSPDESFAPDVAKLRPRARPDNLQEKTEREQLGGRSRTELASLRPRLRPETEKQQAEADETPTEQAVALSLKPRTRPSGFSKIVQKTERSQEDNTRTASVSAAPVIPSTASVARQATVKNALNLHQVNLIGVYGKATDRRALIRLSNGRYKKVKVGDRIDGGKISAISETELRYVKNGRNVVLKMPRG